MSGFDIVFQVIGMVCSAAFIGLWFLAAIGALDMMIVVGGGALDALDEEE